MFLAAPQPTPVDLQFSLLGVPVRVSGWFWLGSALLGWGICLSLARGDQRTLLQYLVIWLAATFVSLLVHEMGHALAYRACGQDAHVVLYHLGGLAIPLGWGRRGARLHDESKALEAYRNVCDRTTWDYWGRPRKPAARGADQTLVAATDAACAILERQGKKDEVQKLRVNLLEAKAEAAAGVLERKEMLARFAEVLAIPGLFTADHAAVEKQFESLEPAARNAALARVAPEAAVPSEDVRALLLETIRDGDAAARRTALRTLIRFTPAEKIGSTVQKAAADARQQSVATTLEPKIRRLRELTGAKEWQKLVDEFKAVDFAAWEDSKLAADALQLRGMAYFNLKKGKQAAADLASAVARPCRRPWSNICGCTGGPG